MGAHASEHALLGGLFFDITFSRWNQQSLPSVLVLWAVLGKLPHVWTFQPSLCAHYSG